MAAFVKSKLKAARDAITKKDFSTALSASQEVLSFESANYNALVFSGLALFELNRDAECEETYFKATQASPDVPLAWQGLLKLHERQKAPKKTLGTLDALLKLYDKSEDATKMAETIQKIIAIQREHGTRTQIIDALGLLLPSSQYYSTLSNLPPPDLTNPTATTTTFAQSAIPNPLPILEEIVELTQKEEDEAIKKEVERRRMRLDGGGKSKEEITNEVGLAVWGASKLPSLYDEIISQPSTSDDLRRSTEAKLFRYRLRQLLATPLKDTRKKELLAAVEEMIRGMVLLEVPDELVWIEWIEGRDNRRVDSDLKLYRTFVDLFPDRPLSRCIRAYLQCLHIPLDPEPNEDDEEEVFVDFDVAFQDLLEASNDPSAEDLILPRRFLTELYLRERDYGECIKIAEEGIQFVEKRERSMGQSLPSAKLSFQESLSTSLTHHFPPKHHPRALGIIDQILSSQPKNVPALLARGYVMRYAEKYTEAGELFSRCVIELSRGGEEGNSMRLLEAKEEVAWCLSLEGKFESALEGLKNVRDELEKLDEGEREGELEERKAKVWWRIGKTLWEWNENESRSQAYSHFIQSLKHLPTYAPAFTSLGIHYSSFASPPDPIRASKCFQKAVELDPREGDAARRLAEGFADEREWDLVEVVARRTIEGEGGNEGGQGVLNDVGAAARYKPVNAWAWKAIGVVELNRKNFQPAIISLQIALRADSNDYKTWIRLGEAYSRSGRPAAALKALNHAHSIAPDDWTCQFFLADVYRQMGLFEQAIEILQSILREPGRENEVGVIAALAESYLALGRTQYVSGFVVRAESSWAQAIVSSCRMLDPGSTAEASGFKRVAWKVIADAVFSLSDIATFVSSDVMPAVQLLLPYLSAQTNGEETLVAGIKAWPSVVAGTEENELLGKNLAWIGSFAYHVRVGLCADESDLEAAALYDYAVSLHRLSRDLISDADADRLTDEMNSALKRALRGDPANEMYWNALGAVNFSSNPKIAQHAFIKAIELDGKSSVFWTNLGLFYLHHGDTDLANQALYKAQVLNPEYSPAWIGQAFVAITNGHMDDAKAVLQHAITLPLPVPQGEYEYGSRVLEDVTSLDHHQEQNPDSNSTQLISAYFALRRYTAQLSQDPTGLHLFALLAERLRQFELAEELLVQAVSLLERAYEETEDEGVERRFGIANANLGRVRLALGRYDEAKEAFEVVLGLTEAGAGAGGGDGDAASRASEVALLRVQAQFGIGLARFKNDELEEALAAFEASAEGVPESAKDVKSHVAILTAQTLWAIGGAEAQEAARGQLLECIGEDSTNLDAITTLTAIGILSDDEELVQASLSEILSASPEERVRLDPSGSIDRLLVLQSLHTHSNGGEGSNDSEAYELLLSAAKRARLSISGRARSLLDLAQYHLQTGQTDVARRILLPLPTDTDDDDPVASLDLAPLFYSEESFGDRYRLAAIAVTRSSDESRDVDGEADAAQEEPVQQLPSAGSLATRSVLSAPWKEANWSALAVARADAASAGS